MELDHYEIEVGSKGFTYEFVSVGTKGMIQKLIRFSLIDEMGFYNLAFGDKNLDKGEIDDMSITDNGDSEKVLATVVASIYAFCRLNPKAWIYATGSTPSRTRLYQMGINKYFDIAETDFEIFGETQIDWETYIKGKRYQAFLIQKKTLHLNYGRYK